MNALRAILQGRGGLLQRLFGNKPPSEEELKHFSDTVFKCTLCANCEEVCPVGIGLKDLWLSLRVDMVHSGSYPPKIDMIRKTWPAAGTCSPKITRSEPPGWRTCATRPTTAW